jgi:UDP-N-acetylglucosamine 2-epimerase (non-hydrolysing)
MKIVTILGTRPEIIRLSRIIPLLDEMVEHVLVHTGQNFNVNLSDVFFAELGVRQPDHHLAVQGESTGSQIAQILTGSERILASERPDRLLVLGDTNSALSAIIAKRMGIPVYHMEAGNRCYDDRVPEETNRRIIDHSSDVLMPYTERSRANLLREGIAGDRIFVTGNPIFEVIQHYDPAISRSTVLDRLQLRPREFCLVTLHRAENVDDPDRLERFASALELINGELGVPVIVSTHPRTRSRLDKLERSYGSDRLRFVEPFGFFDFIALERQARIVLSDSGTVQEECAIFGIPNVTLRDVTERPETMECGSNVLSGSEPEAILRCAKMVLAREPRWHAPPAYLTPAVSDIVLKILCSFSLRY